MQTVDDIDLEVEFNKGELLLPTTKGSYLTYLKKFATFVKYEYDKRVPLNIPKHLLTDENIAKFLVALGKN